MKINKLQKQLRNYQKHILNAIQLYENKNLNSQYYMPYYSGILNAIYNTNILIKSNKDLNFIKNKLKSMKQNLQRRIGITKIDTNTINNKTYQLYGIFTGYSYIIKIISDKGYLKNIK